MSKTKIIMIEDRYSATGTPRPVPNTVCRGMCEGMGFHPCKPGTAASDAAISRAVFDGRLLNGGKRDDIGWFWMTCETCRGARVR